MGELKTGRLSGKPRYVLHSGFLSNLRLPWKTELPWNFSLYWIYVLHSGFLSNLRLPWKTECALKFFTVLNIRVTFRIFEHLALALKIFKPGWAATLPDHTPRTPMTYSIFHPWPALIPKQYPDDAHSSHVRNLKGSSKNIRNQVFYC